MSVEVSLAQGTKTLSELTQREQFKVIKGLLDHEPSDRLSVLDTALDLETTRLRTLGMKVLGTTAEILPEEAFPIIEKGLYDSNDRVSASALTSLVAATRPDPERAIPALEYAFTRRAPVREAAAALVIQLFESDRETGLPFLVKMAEDKPNSWRNASHIEKVIGESPELFDLDNSSPTPDDEIEANQWRKLLEKQLAHRGHSAITIAADLIKENPTWALNVVVLAQKIEEAQPQDDNHLYRGDNQSTVGTLLTSHFWHGNNGDEAQLCYDEIQRHPEAKAYLDRDIEWVKSDDCERGPYSRGASWQSVCQAVPELKERFAEFFADHTRRLSGTSEEYTNNREELKARTKLPEIFGIGAVDIHGIETPDGYYNDLRHYKYQIEHVLDAEQTQRRVSGATLAKIQYLKGLFANDDSEEVNDERLENFFKYHIDEQMVAYRESMARIPEWQERFLARLPVGVDREMARHRIKETTIVFFDELSALTTWHSRDAGGTFDDRWSVSRIDLTESPVNQEKIYTHEMLHALSGRSLVFHPQTLADRQTIINQRVGFHFTPYDKNGFFVSRDGKSRFRWLNEAVTEDITQEMMAGAGYSTYHDERRLLHALRTCGEFEIDNEVFRLAYFENFEPRTADSQPIPHWKELQAQLREAYGEPILVKIDEIVSEQGVRVAISELESRHRRARGSSLFGGLRHHL